MNKCAEWRRRGVQRVVDAEVGGGGEGRGGVSKYESVNIEESTK